MCVCVANAMPRPLSPGIDPEPILYEAVWASQPFWTGAKILDPTGLKSVDRPTRSE